MRFTLPTLLLILFLSGTRCYGQSPVDAELQTLFSNRHATKTSYANPLKESRNEIDATIGIAFLVYKSVLSSQDRPSCVFTPSCSEYAVEAFSKKGVLTGYLQTFDRLTRCHGFANPRHYAMNSTKTLFYDPVD